MKKSCYFTFIFVLGITLNVTAQNKLPADTLHDASLTRPASIIKEEPRWDLTTFDFYTPWLSNGLYGFYGPQPQIMLNGIPLNANVFGWQNLNMLPVFVQNINKAVSQFAPGAYHQTVAGAGLINFKTETLKQGLTVKATYYTGNETKDPGPWAYDSLKMSPNIDRWGPDKAILLGYKAPHWFAKALYVSRFHKPRDIARNLRLHITNSRLGTNVGYKNHLIFIDSKSGLFKAGFNTSHWQFSSRFILSNNKDYLFLQAYGREIPVEIKYRQFAVQGEYNRGGWGINIRYLFDNKVLDKREQIHTYIFNWEQANHTFSVSGEYKTKHWRLSPGFIYKQFNTDAPGLNRLHDNLFTFFLKGGVSWDDVRFYVNNYLDIHQNTGSKSVSVRLGAAIQASDTYAVNPEIYYAESIPLRQNSFIYWVNRGYNFANRLGIEFSNRPYIYENEVLSAKIVNRFSFGDFNIEITPQFLKNYRLNIPWQQVSYNTQTHTQPYDFTVTQHSGQRLKLLIVFEHAYDKLFQQTLSIYLQNTIKGSKRYRNYFKQVPNTKIKYQFDITPVQGLQFSINGIYRSSTTWAEYAALNGKEYHLPIGIPIGDFSKTFHTTTPSFFNVGLSVRKLLLDKHLSVQLGIKNLLDQEVRYHSIGASLYPRVDFKVSLRF